MFHSSLSTYTKEDENKRDLIFINPFYPRPFNPWSSPLDG